MLLPILHELSTVATDDGNTVAKNNHMPSFYSAVVAAAGGAAAAFLDFKPSFFMIAFLLFVARHVS